MGDTVSRKALIDHLDKCANDLYERGGIVAAGVLVILRDELEGGAFPSTESEGETDDGWRVCPSCGEDYRKGEEIIVDRETDKLRAVFKRIETELSDDPSPRAQWVVAVIDEALKEGEGK